MWEFLESIENSGFATYIRETPTCPAYSTVLALHTFGMAFLVGLSGVIALRVLGVVPELPLNPLKKPAADDRHRLLGERHHRPHPDDRWRSESLLDELGLLREARRDRVRPRRRSRRCAVTRSATPQRPTTRPHPPQARRWAKAMLFFWGLAVLGGRLTAYATNIRIQSAAAVVVAVVVLLLLARFLVHHARRVVTARHAVAARQSVTAR